MNTERPIKRRSYNGNPDWPEPIHPLLLRVYSSRNIRSADELRYPLARLLPGQGLTSCDRAASLLADLLEQDRALLIIADYDADGATACALAIRGLLAMGARNVSYLVPDRFLHGYGLSPAVVELALERQADAIITVDNGISSIEGVALARGHGVEVIVTDHHLPGNELPQASVIVNPNLPGDGFSSKCIAGVGVMFYVLAALRAELRTRGWFEKRNIIEPNLANSLDLVALGTVADVVPLDYNNRIMVNHGLSLIHAGRCVPGIRALLKVANKRMDGIVAGDLGFSVGPRLNAAGRLKDMSLGIECLISDDEEACLRMAAELDAINRERREIQELMQQEALEEIARIEADDNIELAGGVCLFNEGWHSGVIGILASKLKDSLHRPVIAFAQDNEGVLKGSARSVNGVHIRDVIDRIATLHPGLIVTFGGHAMAAGLTIFEHAYEEFSRLFNAEIERHFRENGHGLEIITDGELDAADFSLQTAQLLRAGGPWGQGFPEPVFDGVFTVIDKKIVGESHLKMKLGTGAPGHGIEAIAFNMTDEAWPPGTRTITAVYRLDLNEYRGRQTPQLIIDYLQPLAD